MAPYRVKLTQAEREKHDVAGRKLTLSLDVRTREGPTVPRSVRPRAGYQTSRGVQTDRFAAI